MEGGVGLDTKVRRPRYLNPRVFSGLGQLILLSANFGICFGDPWAAQMVKYANDNERFNV